MPSAISEVLGCSCGGACAKAGASATAKTSQLECFRVLVMEAVYSGVRRGEKEKVKSNLVRRACAARRTFWARGRPDGVIGLLTPAGAGAAIPAGPSISAAPIPRDS